MKNTVVSGTRVQMIVASLISKFVYETVKTYLWQFKFTLAVVSKNIIKSSIIVM